MDPNETLQRIHDARARWVGTTGATAVEALIDMAEAFEELDRWLSRGGFLPEAWAR